MTPEPFGAYHRALHEAYASYRKVGLDDVDVAGAGLDDIAATITLKERMIADFNRDIRAMLDSRLSSAERDELIEQCGLEGFEDDGCGA